MRKIIYILSFLGYSSFVIAADLPSKACLVLEADKIEVCLSEAHSMWDKNLNTVYKNVIGYLPKGKKTELQNQQHAWIKERDKKCEALSTTAEKKACYLDETQIKTLALKNQETDLMPKIFEGDWRVKYGKGKDYDMDNYGANDGFLILQNGHNICGTWEYFATGIYEGIFEARIEEKNVAQTIRISGRQDYRYIMEESNADWDNYDKTLNPRYIVFKVCSNNKLYESVTEKKNEYLSMPALSCDSLEIGENQSNGLVKRVISKEEKESILKNNHWLTQCLNNKE